MQSMTYYIYSDRRDLQFGTHMSPYLTTESLIIIKTLMYDFHLVTYDIIILM
jgi:hypothetical protein